MAGPAARFVAAAKRRSKASASNAEVSGSNARGYGRSNGLQPKSHGLQPGSFLLLVAIKDILKKSLFLDVPSKMLGYIWIFGVISVGALEDLHRFL